MIRSNLAHVAHVTTTVSLVLCAGTTLAQQSPVSEAPAGGPPRPTYPEGVAVPRSMTDAERAWVAEHPITAPSGRAATSPVGPVHCVAEYEPMDGIVFAWEGDSSQQAIQRQMVEKITTVGRRGRVDRGRLVLRAGDGADVLCGLEREHGADQVCGADDGHDLDPRLRPAVHLRG
jgi:hypothetical protein